MRFVHAVSSHLGFVCGISGPVWLIWRGIGCVGDDGRLENLCVVLCILAHDAMA